MKRRIDLLLRFFCGRKGAATARALISAWSVIGVPCAGALLWIASEAWSEFKAMRQSLGQIERYVAGDAERWTAIRGDLGDVKSATSTLTERVNAIDVRLARQEGRR